jgi:hypothetical protein
MRAIFKIATLLFISITSVLAGIDGYYYNPRLHESIRIIEHNRDVVIKGLFNDNRITRFEKVRGRTYEDRYGNILVCEDRNTVKLKRWRTRDYIRFDKVDDHRGRDDWHRYHDYDDDCDVDRRYDDRYDNRHGHHEHYDNRRYDNYDSKDKEYKSDRKNDYYRGDQSIAFNSGSSTRFVGTWDVKNGNYNSVAIIDTREGLKAKFSGTTNWVNYTQSQSRSNEYIDDRGNRYIFDRDDEGKWFPADKGKKVIDLKKVSNEVRY